jgi:hypothetical protein
VFILVGHKTSCVALSTIFLELRAHMEEIGTFNYLDNHILDSFRFGIGSRTPEQTNKGAILELFCKTEGLSCSYLKDIVSIALNTSGIRLRFSSNIDTQRECRFVLTLIALAAGDSFVLGSKGRLMYQLSTPGHQTIVH